MKKEPFNERNAPKGYKAVPSYSIGNVCGRCAFDAEEFEKKCKKAPCTFIDRPDKTDVYFVKLEEG